MTRDITMSNGEIYFNGIGCNKTNNQVSGSAIFKLISQFH